MLAVDPPVPSQFSREILSAQSVVRSSTMRPQAPGARGEMRRMPAGVVLESEWSTRRVGRGQRMCGRRWLRDVLPLVALPSQFQAAPTSARAGTGAALVRRRRVAVSQLALSGRWRDVGDAVGRTRSAQLVRTLAMSRLCRFPATRMTRSSRWVTANGDTFAWRFSLAEQPREAGRRSNTAPAS